MNKYIIDTLEELIYSGVYKLNKNLQVLKEKNKFLSVEFIRLYTFYKVGNTWNDLNRSIKKKLIEEYYRILLNYNPFLNLQLTEELFQKLVRDTEEVKETINDFNFTSLFGFNVKLEFNDLVEYMIKYTTYNKTENKFMVVENLKELLEEKNYEKE